MKLCKRLRYAYELEKSKFFIFDPLLGCVYQYHSYDGYMELEEILSDYDAEEISSINLMSLDDLIRDILDDRKVFEMFGYRLYGRWSQDDLTSTSYVINYQEKSHTHDLECFKGKADKIITLDFPDDLLYRLDNIYKTSSISERSYF